MCSFQNKVFLKNACKIKKLFINLFPILEKKKVSKKQEALCKACETFSKRFFI